MQAVTETCSKRCCLPKSAPKSVQEQCARMNDPQDHIGRSKVYVACRGSPTSQKICFRHVKAAKNLSLARVLEEDYRLLHHMCHISNDFVEGIRAKLIEKDNNARWKPATVNEVGFNFCLE